MQGRTFPPEWERHEAVWIGWDESIFADPDHQQLRLDMLPKSLR